MIVAGMAKSLRHKFLIIMLGILVTLGMSLTVVHSNIMAVDVAMADGMTKMEGMSASSKGPCPDCLDGKNMTKGTLCVAGCVTAVQMVQSAADHFKPLWTDLALLASSGTRYGRTYRPDPYPPRTLGLA